MPRLTFRAMVLFAVEFLPLAALVFALVGIIEPLLPFKVDLIVRSLVAIVFGAAYVPLVRWLSSGETTRWLKTSSDAFVDFYSSWYAREGKIHVYCSDLLWLQDTNRESIVHALELKGPEASVYLRNLSGTVVQRLRDRGVQIYQVPAEVQLLVKFSLREDNNHREVVIRTKVAESAKQRKKSKERVHESPDQNLIALALEFLESLRQDDPNKTE